jgi:hypothetical protein
MGARYYVSWMARWIAVDPLEAKYTLESSYNYCHNNPIGWTDRTGMGSKKTGGDSRITPAIVVVSGSSTQLTPTPAVQSAAKPKPLFGDAKPGDQLDGKARFYKRAPGGWVPSNDPLVLVGGSPNEQDMQSRGSYTAEGAAKKDAADMAQRRNAELSARVNSPEAAQARDEVARSANPVWVNLRITYEVSDVKAALTAVNEYSDGNYVRGSLAALPFLGKIGKEFNALGNDLRALEGGFEMSSGQPLYRFDRRSPQEIEQAGGFQAWGNNMDIEDHVHGFSIEDKTSGYISTSKDLQSLLNSLYDGTKGYIYEIKPQSSGIDAAEAFKQMGKTYPFPNEAEIMVPNQIPLQDIIGSQPYVK